MTLSEQSNIIETEVKLIPLTHTTAHFPGLVQTLQCGGVKLVYGPLPSKWNDVVMQVFSTC